MRRKPGGSAPRCRKQPPADAHKTEERRGRRRGRISWWMSKWLLQRWTLFSVRRRKNGGIKTSDDAAQLPSLGCAKRPTAGGAATDAPCPRPASAHRRECRAKNSIERRALPGWRRRRRAAAAAARRQAPKPKTPPSADARLQHAPPNLHGRDDCFAVAAAMIMKLGGRGAGEFQTERRRARSRMKSTQQFCDMY